MHILYIITLIRSRRALTSTERKKRSQKVLKVVHTTVKPPSRQATSLKLFQDGRSMPAIQPQLFRSFDKGNNVRNAFNGCDNRC